MAEHAHPEFIQGTRAPIKKAPAGAWDYRLWGNLR